MPAPIVPDATSATSPAAPAPGRGFVVMTGLVVGLFFVWGFATVLIDTLIPKLKGLFALSYAEAMLTQFAFFLAYLVVSIPAGMLLARIGYLRGIVAGLAIMAAGCLLFAPAAQLGVYAAFLVALFIMASGITILQVAANPLIAVLGRPETSHSRLNLAQAFNSLGTFVGPFVGSALILSGGVATIEPEAMAPEVLAALRRTEAQSVQLPFLGIAAVLAVMALAFWLLRRNPVTRAASGAQTRVSSLALFLRHRRLALGALSIFLYVGAEVSIGSIMVNYLMLDSTLGAPATRAGFLISLYWGGAMVGRFIGSVVLQRVRAGHVLAFCAAMAAVLAVTSSLSLGLLAAATIIAVGLFNSIMFPTIFTLAIEDLGPDTPQASGILCLAIFGGAVIPPICGWIADQTSLSVALLAPAACYLWIAAYGLITARKAGQGASAAV